MFDNISPQPNNDSPLKSPTPTPGGSSMPAHTSEPDDIFAGTDAAPTANRPKPPQLQPKNIVPATNPAMMGHAQNMATAPTPAKPAKPASSGGRIYFIVGLVVIVILVVVLVGMVALAYYKAKQSDTADQNNTTNQEQSINNADQNTNDITDNEQKDLSYIVDEIKDSDNDGIFDAEEIRLGTNPNAADSDNDGLFDREELRVYQTDPLNPDSDSDGYSDGDEVQNGYNPSGSGKLLELPQ